MIREINVSEITAAVKEMCIQANHFLSPDMDKALKAATANEESSLGKKILNQLQENLKIEGEIDMITYSKVPEVTGKKDKMFGRIFR